MTESHRAAPNRLAVVPVLGAVAGINLLAAYLLHPAVHAAMDGVPGALLPMLWLTALASPIVASLRALLFTAIAWCVATLAESPFATRHAFLVGVLGEAIIACNAVFSGVVIRISGPVDSPADLLVPQGADLFMEIGSGLPRAIVDHAGVFYLLWAVVAYLGLRQAAGMGRWTSALAVCTYWLALVASGAVRQASL